ncbi:hypothetical protein [Reinekea sp.]|jgi:hypothetical protein|uniref:hypothetical protein n=1 Tax=Reinekea sp. TaxID=1970455 RepID=UPI002A7ED2AB|nr:hypothetical protein [Reinekea sp.]
MAELVDRGVPIVVSESKNNNNVPTRLAENGMVCFTLGGNKVSGKNEMDPIFDFCRK